MILAVFPILGRPPCLSSAAAGNYSGDPEREVVRLFIDREADRAQAEAFRRSLDIWAAYCRPRSRDAGFSRDLKRLQKWLEDPRNQNCLPPPELCPPFPYAPYPPPFFYQRFIPRNYWRWWTKRWRELQVGPPAGIR